MRPENDLGRRFDLRTLGKRSRVTVAPGERLEHHRSKEGWPHAHGDARREEAFVSWRGRATPAVAPAHWDETYAVKEPNHLVRAGLAAGGAGEYRLHLLSQDGAAGQLLSPSLSTVTTSHGGRLLCSSLSHLPRPLTAPEERNRAELELSRRRSLLLEPAGRCPRNRRRVSPLPHAANSRARFANWRTCSVSKRERYFFSWFLVARRRTGRILLKETRGCSISKKCTW
jgi:hypothetical protein